MSKDKQKALRLYAEVASLLIDFKTYVNKDHGEDLLRQWDIIREKFDNG